MLNSQPSPMGTAQKKQICILGATGTIGQHTLQVLSLHPDQFAVFALCAHHNVEKILPDCLRFQPAFAVMMDASAAQRLQQALQAHQSKTVVLSGLDAMTEMACHPQVDIVMAAIVGAAGLLPAMAAAKAGKRILLANKETLVMAGDLFMQAVRAGQAELLPIDSEHNAIFQVMPTHTGDNLLAKGVSKIILTASGGPFRQLSQAQLEQVTLAQALTHPNWVMGPKITIDSATMMNKGLEVIEAYWLFAAQIDQIEVVVHPQSVIHSMVAFVDGSVLAQLGTPDMRTPIAYALSYPERIDSGVKPLHFSTLGKLEFEAPDTQRFPCLALAYQALQTGGTAPAVLNAANEVAVAQLIQGRIRFHQIAALIDAVLQAADIQTVQSIEQLLDLDQYARTQALAWVEQYS